MGSNNLYDFQRFFEMSGDLLVIAGDDGYFKRVNPAVEQLLGYTAEELCSKPMRDFQHPDDREITANRRKRLFETGKMVTGFENRYITSKGETVWLSWTSMPSLAEKLVFAVAKNITHRKQHEQERNRMLEKVVQTNAELKRLSYATSHDIRLPVSNLLAAFEVLDSLEVEDVALREMHDVLRQSAIQLKSTLDAYLDEINNRLAGQDNNEAVVLLTQIEQVVDSLSQSIKAADGEVRLWFGKEVVVWGNAVQLRSVFLNLFSNALKYTRKGVPPIVEVHAFRQDGKWEISVNDNGTGFDAHAFADHIFQPNTRLHTEVEGKGIGLHLVREMLERMGGSIRVESEPGSGSNFIVQLAAHD